MTGWLTERMVKHASGIVAYHTYPHVDFFDTGKRAARLLLRILSDGAKPVTAVVPVPALVRGDELITETGLFGRVIEKALLERDHHVGTRGIGELDDVASMTWRKHEDFVGAAGFGHDVHGAEVTYG
jgi:hypothetical protein